MRRLEGKLYTFQQAQSVCPEGWRYLPSDDEWQKLEMELGLPYDKSLEVGRVVVVVGEKLLC